MATESVRELIVQHIEQALSAINGTGPYHTALTTIVPRGDDWPKHVIRLPAARVSEGEEAAEERPLGKMTRRLPVVVEARLGTVAGSPTPVDTLANRLLADLERAVTADPTRGGRAVGTSMLGNSFTADVAPGVLVEARVTFLVEFRTKHGDPATQG